MALKHFNLTWLAILSLVLNAPLDGWSQDLHEQLSSQSLGDLAADSREFGDANRGAVVFYQQQLSCTRCHIPDREDHLLGPDLTRLGKEATDAYLIESVLDPSKVIKKGYEPVALVTNRGEVATGVLVSKDDEKIVARVVEKNFKLVEFKRSDLASAEQGETSIMPSGQMNLLTSRQQFLDLIAYLIAIRDGGAARARELVPPPSLYAARPVPEYEKRIDHAGILGSLDREAYLRGQETYDRLCINCHGTKDRPGSLPTSLRFASGEFKNGKDPHSMYKTLTHGFGMMVAQTWMVPTQKYDVIHYVREEYLKRHNPSQFFQIDEDYVARLPRGDTKGPAPLRIQAWSQMDYGPNLCMTLEVGEDASNFAYKGNVVRLDAGPGGVSQGRYWMLYDYDTLRVAAAWSGESFTDWNGINFNGKLLVYPRLTGELHVENPIGPGWGRPKHGSFKDIRLVGRDDRIYGPLPRDWAHYKGMYYHGPHTIMSYTVGNTAILETPGVLTDGPVPVYTRTFNVGPRSSDLVLQVAHRRGESSKFTIRDGIIVFGAAAEGPDGLQERPTKEVQRARGMTVASVAGDTQNFEWFSEGGDLRLRVPVGKDSRRFTLWFTNVERDDRVPTLADSVTLDEPRRDLSEWTHGGPKRWPEVLTAEATLGPSDGPFAVDVLKRPTDNPWFCRMRLTGHDFTADGDSVYVSAWDGSIWLVSGLSQLAQVPEEGGQMTLTWRRVASGLFQPLGLKIVDGKIFVTCRDQICALHDLNGDGEFDYFESFNNDHQVTDHFHEFAMGLQADDEGNLYYAKSARDGKTAVVPHHGTLLRVSKDGSKTEIVANGFRAANGVCLNPDGTFIVTDQEGHWTPKNRINYVKVGGFYGNMLGYHDVKDSSDDAMEQPLCWITNSFDRSPAELLWVDSKKWGPLDETLLSLSYGYGKVYIVPHEKVDGQAQGGMCELPIPAFSTGTIRGRFHPGDGQLYLTGMYGWGGNQQQPGGLYRIRYTGKPAHLPVGIEATEKGVLLTFSGEFDAASIDASKFRVKVWDLKRTAGYGSEHYNERALEVESAKLQTGGRRIFLEIPEISPTWSMEIRYQLKSKAGRNIEGKIHNTIYRLKKA